jgi:succinate dehydrogenase/fumarate reductase flavoprotein subunit
MPIENVIETDVLVIGGGVSGMFAAVKARDEGVSVTVVEKGYAGKAGAALWAYGMSIFNPGWGHNLKNWMTQIAETGDYMNDPEWTEILLKDAYDRYQDLVSWGAQFPRGAGGELIPHRRKFLQSYHAPWKDMLLIMRQAVLKSGAQIMDRIMMTDLLKQDGRVVGAVGFHAIRGDFYVFKAKATVMCAGSGILGVGGGYAPLSTYGGETMAYRAGAELSGKEFTITGIGPFSYMGTGYGYCGDRGEGETKISLEGKPLNPELADGFTPMIDRYVDSEGYKVNRYTMLATAHLGRMPLYWNLDDATPAMRSFPVTFKHGVELKDNPPPDLPEGGLYRAVIQFEKYVGWALDGASGIASTDTKGGTSLPGLFAAGNNYSSRALGAKYPGGGLASCNASVVGARAGRGAAEFAKKTGTISVDPAEVGRLKQVTYLPIERKSGFDQDWVNLQMKTITYPYYVWCIKHGDRLKAALTMVDFVRDHLAPLMYANPKDPHGLRVAHETRGRVAAIEMMLRASLFRTESRGVHYREDYPHRDDPSWLAEVRLKKNDGQMELVKKPFAKEVWPDLSISYNQRYPLEYLGEESIRAGR